MSYALLKNFFTAVRDSKSGFLILVTDPVYSSVDIQTNDIITISQQSIDFWDPAGYTPYSGADSRATDLATQLDLFMRDGDYVGDRSYMAYVQPPVLTAIQHPDYYYLEHSLVPDVSAERNPTAWRAMKTLQSYFAYIWPKVSSSPSVTWMGDLTPYWNQVQLEL